jgi:hypothetical protein
MQNTPYVKVVRVLMYRCKNLKPTGIHVRTIQSIRVFISSGLLRASGLSFRQAYSEHPACHIVRPTQNIRHVISSGLLRGSGLSFRKAYSERSLSFRRACSEHPACHFVRPTQSIPRHPYSERLVTAVHPAVNCTHTFKSEFQVNFTGPLHCSRCLTENIPPSLLLLSEVTT